MADGAGACHLLKVHILECLRYQAHRDMALELRVCPVGRDDARAFLAAVLEREETIVGHQRGIRMSMHGEDAALVFWLIRRRINQGSARQGRR